MQNQVLERDSISRPTLLTQRDMSSLRTNWELGERGGQPRSLHLSFLSALPQDLNPVACSGSSHAPHVAGSPAKWRPQTPDTCQEATTSQLEQVCHEKPFYPRKSGRGYCPRLCPYLSRVAPLWPPEEKEQAPHWRAVQHSSPVRVCPSCRQFLPCEALSGAAIRRLPA